MNDGLGGASFAEFEELGFPSPLRVRYASWDIKRRGGGAILHCSTKPVRHGAPCQEQGHRRLNEVRSSRFVLKSTPSPAPIHSDSHGHGIFNMMGAIMSW